jgi:hypothetical protein
MQCEIFISLEEFIQENKYFISFWNNQFKKSQSIYETPYHLLFSSSSYKRKSISNVSYFVIFMHTLRANAGKAKQAR